MVAQLVEALHYKPKGRGFDSRWCHWNISGDTMDLGVDSASNRNEYQASFLGGKGGRCLGLTTLPSLCADCLEIWEPQPPGTLRACSVMYRGGCTVITCTQKKWLTSVLSEYVRQGDVWHQVREIKTKIRQKIAAKNFTKPV